MNTVSI